MTRRSTEDIAGFESCANVSHSADGRPDDCPGRAPCKGEAVTDAGKRPGVIRRLFGARKGPRPLDPDRTDLVVVAASFDDAEACSTALERGTAGEPALQPDEQVLLRHHLRLPDEFVTIAADIAAQDHYVLADVGPAVDGVVELKLQRVQVLDALHCSQERSRMAGLAQRHDGTVLGWDALQPAPE